MLLPAGFGVGSLPSLATSDMIKPSRDRYPKRELDRANERIDLHFDEIPSRNRRRARGMGFDPMKLVRSVGTLREALEPARQAGRTIGLVPTMGALHQGHLSLVSRARLQCDVVVVSLFVNPAQFNEEADLDRYPRQEARDRELAEQAGADLLFAPSSEEVYPAGFSTSVEVLGLTDRLEGAVRGAAHFRGVTTVVTKLLNMVAPDVAFFGQKDAQQALVIRRLVADLNIPVRIEVCPTVREPDGLAMSSRNARLDAPERARALALHAALEAAAAAVSQGARSAEEVMAAGRAAMEPFALDPEYLALVSPSTLEPIGRLDGPALLAIAARVGSTRLIDNVVLDPTALAGQQSGACPDAGRFADPESDSNPLTSTPTHTLTPTPAPAPAPAPTPTPTPREAQAICSA
jgi:pantoate--beta-alanine ligase